MKRSALLVTFAAMVVVGLAGCSSETQGDATAGDSTTTEGGNPPTFPESDTSDEPTETAPAESGTADLRPCDLLSAQDLNALGLPSSGREEELGGGRTCAWQASGSHTVTVAIFDELGIDDVQAQNTPEPLTVGSHDAVRYIGVLESCGVTLAVTDMSRVDVLGAAGGNTDRACQVAKQAAELVEPKLP